MQEARGKCSFFRPGETERVARLKGEAVYVFGTRTGPTGQGASPGLENMCLVSQVVADFREEQREDRENLAPIKTLFEAGYCHGCQALVRVSLGPKPPTQQTRRLRTQGTMVDERTIRKFGWRG